MPWEFLYLLPNLSMPAEPAPGNQGQWPDGLDLETGFLSIVSPSDPRVTEIRERDGTVDQLLRSFRSAQGRPHSPAVLIANRDVPETIRHNDSALVSFRNAVALAIVLRGRTAVVTGVGGGQGPTWTDSFDFHPAQLSATGRIVILSPALRALVATEEPLHLGPSPYLPTEGRQLFPDMHLYRSLGAEWRYQYQRLNAPNPFGRSLFRSLEVAYEACSIGAKNQGSIYDYGLQVAHWVSAIEILAWPGARHASFENVLRLLERAPLHHRLRDRRYQAKMKRRGPPRRMNALERAYSYLYLTRNRFLHGNPVSPSLLFTRGNAPVAIPRIAAVVYRAALAAYLDDRYPARARTIDDLRERPGLLFSNLSYDRALAEAFGRRLP